MKKILGVLMLSASIVACGPSAKEKEQIRIAAEKRITDSLRLDSFKKVEIARQEKIEQERVAAAAAAAAAAAERRSYARSSYRSSGSGSGSSSSSYGGTQATAKKKGWSDAAKGTLIGAGAGAVGGALIDKKKGRGAVIGGLIGAGTGYVIGRGEDRKSGRVQPRN
ncbi:hypothetical protein C7T94_10225 [Pedobacter yulinensis]|uniref:YMGG-like Gly-zipper domain-containing protein n=1 Tax=Pedobacter yulinensis TaxID=2126353 RepID=A0A2T3HKL2_9SPHI|nr:YMGG-like glycine zipper-containing protein [Pedobacter yulinensis]PST82995.1 hypothetical protein C7T94_10225 [Pedobacter yulinensis]